MMKTLQQIQDDLSFHHESGDISRVNFEIAGVGIRRVRVSRLPPEVTEPQIINLLSTYGDIKQIQDEIWSQACRFKVKTGVRLLVIGMKKKYSVTYQDRRVP